MDYKEEDFLSIAGIQHFVFCRRQWALIHIEQQWAENLRTMEGHILHERAHDGQFTEKRGGLLVTRGLPVFSRELGVNGVCDVVEFHRSEEGVPLFGRTEKYLPAPVEYKRGKPKEHDADELQLCCQAMCLEEMLLCRIDKGYLYYGEPKRRQEVFLSAELRGYVKSALGEMHDYYNRGYTPKSKPGKHCKACSMADVCMPELLGRESVKEYLDRQLEEL